MRPQVHAPTLRQSGVLVALFGLACFGLFVTGYDQGQVLSLTLGDLSYQLNVVHEFFHDARHAAGLACH